MKKKSLFVGLLLSLSSIAMGQTTQAVAWVNQVGSGSQIYQPETGVKEEINAIAEDANGNIYAVGSFRESLTVSKYTSFNSDGTATGYPTNQTFTSAGESDGIILRYDKFGKCTWAYQIGGAGVDEIQAIALWETSGTPMTPNSFYITGKFSSQLTIGGNQASVYQGETDMFVSRFNVTGFTGVPTHAWTNNIGGPAGPACGLGVAVSSYGVFVTGYYSSVANDITNTFVLQKNTNNNGSPNPISDYRDFADRDMFLMSLSLSGVINGITQPTYSMYECEGTGIAFYNDFLYVVGTYQGDFSLNGNMMSCAGHSDIFVAKYRPTLVAYPLPTAVVKLGSPNDIYGQGNQGTSTLRRLDEGKAIAVGKHGVFVTGAFQNSLNIADIPTIDPDINSVTDNYMFLARYNVNLNNTDAEVDVVYGTSKNSFGRDLFIKENGNNTTVVVAGEASGNAQISGMPIGDLNGNGSSIGFLGRVNFNALPTKIKFDNALGNNFVDCIGEENNNILGVASAGNYDPYITGNAVSARGTCEIFVGGFFQRREFFGNHLLNANGTTDGYILSRSNFVAVTSPQVCVNSSTTLSATSGMSSYLWSSQGTNLGTTNSISVTPSATSNTWVNLAVTPLSCPQINTPVVVYQNTAEYVVNGDFNLGNNYFSTNNLTYANSCTEGTYFVGPQLGMKCSSWNSSNFYDHTSGNGNFLIIDGNTGNNMTLWQQTTVLNVNPGTAYKFSFWARNIYGINQFPVSFVINTGSGDVVVGTSTNILSGAWRQYSVIWNSGSYFGPVTLKLNCTAGLYRDFGIDDISFGPLCSTYRSLENEESMSELSANISIYPNPTNGIINLNFIPENVKTIEVMDALGNMIQSHVLNGATNAQFDLNGMAKGIYFVRLISETGSEVHRVILQ